MKPVEYVFRIDAFTPDTIPMARLADYLAVLAKLVGHPNSTHFVRIEAGSARVVHNVELVDAPKVERRLLEVAIGNPPKDAVKAFQDLDNLLVEDNATGELIGPTGAVIIPFPGRMRPKPLTFPAFRQDGSIEGQIVSIGGRDRTAHVILEDQAITYSGITVKRPMAKELALFLYGPQIRLIGSGRWERHSEGAWKLLEFRVDRYEILDDRPLSEILDQVRAIPGNGLTRDPELYRHLLDLRLGKGCWRKCWSIPKMPPRKFWSGSINRRAFGSLISINAPPLSWQQ